MPDDRRQAGRRLILTNDNPQSSTATATISVAFVVAPVAGSVGPASTDGDPTVVGAAGVGRGPSSFAVESGADDDGASTSVSRAGSTSTGSLSASTVWSSTGTDTAGIDATVTAGSFGARSMPTDAGPEMSVMGSTGGSGNLTGGIKVVGGAMGAEGATVAIVGGGSVLGAGSVVGAGRLAGGPNVGGVKGFFGAGWLVGVCTVEGGAGLVEAGASATGLGSGSSSASDALAGPPGITNSPIAEIASAERSRIVGCLPWP